MADWGLNLTLIGAFAALALLLAMVGIYGVMPYHVSERKREIGVRMALGATPGDVGAGVVGKAMRLVWIGIAIGTALAYAVSGAVTQLLFEVEPTDLTVFAAVPALLMTTGMLACYLPAKRASRLDPADALRAEQSDEFHSRSRRANFWRLASAPRVIALIAEWGGNGICHNCLSGESRRKSSRS